MPNAFVAKLLRLSALDLADVAALNRLICHSRSISRHKDIIREGDRPGPLIVVLDGWACRYKVLPNGARQITGFLMPGDACDLHANLMAEMDHSIQAIAPVIMCRIERTDVDAIMAAHPQIAKAMYLAQLVDEGTLRAWITSMGRRSSVERVAHLMCELYVRAQNVGLAVDNALPLPLTQVLLADALGLTPVHLNRVLKELRVAGAMTLSRGSLTINDPARLVRIAGFDENYLHRRLRIAA